MSGKISSFQSIAISAAVKQYVADAIHREKESIEMFGEKNYQEMTDLSCPSIS